MSEHEGMPIEAIQENAVEAVEIAQEKLLQEEENTERLTNLAAIANIAEQHGGPDAVLEVFKDIFSVES